MATKLIQDAVGTLMRHERSLLVRVLPLYLAGVALITLWFSRFDLP